MKNINFYLAFVAVFLASLTACKTDEPIPIDCATAASVSLLKADLKSNENFFAIQEANLLRITKVSVQSWEEKDSCKGGILQTVLILENYENIPCEGKALWVNDYLYEVQIWAKEAKDSIALLEAICKKEGICLQKDMAYYKSVVEVYKTHDDKNNLVIGWRDRCTYLIAQDLRRNCI